MRLAWWVITGGMGIGVAVWLVLRYAGWGIDAGLRKLADTTKPPPMKARRIQVAGRDHVCEVAEGAVFCSICGRTVD